MQESQQRVAMVARVEYTDARTAAFRRTLDRLPDEIALAIGLHVYDGGALSSGFTCVCGWAVREAFARVLNRDAGSRIVKLRVTPLPIIGQCAIRFGGSRTAWANIYWGVTNDHAPLIEEALFDRVMAAATAQSSKPQRSATRR